MRRIPLKNKIIGVLLILFVAVNFIPSQYFISEPGPALNLSEMITVEGSYRDDDWGGFYLTSVSQRRASFWDVAVFYLFPSENKELIPVRTAIPPGMSESEYLNLMQELMVESQLSAQAVAYRELGYDVEMRGEGVKVVDLVEDGQSEEILEPDDIILKIDGKEVELASEAVELIKSYPIGTELLLEVKRDEEILEFEITTAEHPEEVGRSSLGIYITTAGLDYDMPEYVNFTSENIVGPSAGVMFSLEIYNQLTEEDITRGNRYAGTGTINFDGEIGRVGGELLKIIAAENDGISTFILPEDHGVIIESLGVDIEIIESPDFRDLLEQLNVE
ncbi:PDZ domain-containing protein [Halanaerobiaceae bacterium Z-7014]|uniref:PDZ domain-containing protein n=1 Tax=Halonatronomonas betaini TaxID=2778430 RepID=A0A931FAB4_9FIRM|nr:PDZ domain-containing protein [Halonatronomonas betaini]MBF8436782.1 PDZ domain-containing protein [Halonatronomonas betaini]